MLKSQTRKNAQALCQRGRQGKPGGVPCVFKRLFLLGLALLLPLLFPLCAHAQIPDGFDLDAQLDAIGRQELAQAIPEEAGELLKETEAYDLSVESLLGLSPGQFIKTAWELFLRQLRLPLRVLAIMGGVILLGAILGGLGDTAWSSAMRPVFQTVSVLCILTSIITPILDCIVDTAQVIRNASIFMLSFIPMFSAAVIAAGQPVSGTTYNLFLFGTCQVISQIVSGVLIPLMSLYLAFCVAGSVCTQININSATGAIKTAVNWALGFLFTLFVGLLSVQSMVAGSADSVTARTAKFLIGSFVPVVGGPLSDAYTAARGCLQLLRASVGAYGIIVALCIFLPVLLQTVSWLLVTKAAVVASDIVGVPEVSAMLKSCGSVLSILMAIILCYALLIIVSTTVILVTGMGI